MDDDFKDELNEEQDVEYTYPKKAGIPIHFSESSESYDDTTNTNVENGFSDENQNKDDFEKMEYTATYIDFENGEDSDSEAAVKNSRSKKLLIVAIAFLSFLVVLLVSYIIYMVRSSRPVSNTTSQNTSITADHTSGDSEIKFESKPEDDREFSAETIYDKVSPSVVGVVVYDSKADIISDPVSEGSGIIISEKGYIVTNSHVVGNSKQNNIKIVLNTNEEFPGKVVGYDSKTDIAVIKVDKTGLKAATFGNSDEVKVGASALALGNPLGLNFASSLTRGIVSAVNRCSNGVSNSLVKYIQTDAAINPGNSGGPLINMYGQVIGINSSKIVVSHCEGMGFAIPSNTVKKVVDDIIDKGYVSGRVRLGLSGKMVSNYQSQVYGVPVGIIISEISSDSNLSSCGIKTGDIITKINDVNVTSLDAFYGELYNHKPGESVKLSIYRKTSNQFTSSSFDASVKLLEDKGETQEAERSSSLR